MIAGTITATDINSTGRYTTHWSRLLSATVPRSSAGTTRKLAVSIACNAKMPKLRRSSAGLRRLAPISAGTVSASGCTWGRGATGTTKSVIATPASEPRHQPENAGDPDPAGDRRPGDDRHQEGEADGHPDERHGLSAIPFRREIGDESEDHRAYRPRALQQATDDHAVDGGRARRD